MTEPENPPTDTGFPLPGIRLSSSQPGSRHTSVSGAAAVPPPVAPAVLAPDTPELQTRRRRLLFRSTHRGTFENDLLVGGFVRAHLGSLTEAEVDALEAVMQMPDTDLADWLTGRAPIPAAAETPMLCRMRDFLAAGPTRSRQSP